jgi:hypothetical protein
VSEAPPSAYPLAWPPHKARTPWQQQKHGQFSSGDRKISRVYALGRLEREVEMLGGRYLVVSSDLELRRDGQPHLGRGEPADPGVCAYFQMKGKPYAMACDTFDVLAQNIAAIAAHIKATRAIERYGVATAAETLQAFQALPPPATGAPKPSRPWWETFGVLRDHADEETVNALYRVKAKSVAADQGALLELNLARDAALAELRA